MIEIRDYSDDDFEEISKLFCETVRYINAKDYTPLQCEKWIQKSDKLQFCRNILLKQRTLIALKGGKIIGFGSVDGTGVIDLLFVHKNYQKLGVGATLLNRLESGFARVKTYASITAKPFFESRGYTVVKARYVDCLGVPLKNYEMIKILFCL